MWDRNWIFLLWFHFWIWIKKELIFSYEISVNLCAFHVILRLKLKSFDLWQISYSIYQQNSAELGLKTKTKVMKEFRGHSTTTWTEFMIFLTPPPLRWQFLYPGRGLQQTFFDPLPPYLFHVVIEWPLGEFGLIAYCVKSLYIFPRLLQLSASNLLKTSLCVEQKLSSRCRDLMDSDKLIFNDLT